MMQKVRKLSTRLPWTGGQGESLSCYSTFHVITPQTKLAARKLGFDIFASFLFHNQLYFQKNLKICGRIFGLVASCVQWLVGEVDESITIGARGLGFDSRAGQSNAVSSPLRRSFGALLNARAQHRGDGPHHSLLALA